MRFRFTVIVAAFALCAMSLAGKDKAAVSSKDIADFAADSGDFGTLVTALKAASLVDTLKGAGPFTLFAPTNDAFAKLPAGNVDTLVKPENKDTLSKILTYHLMAGKVTLKQLKGMIKQGQGKAELKTVEGAKLTASLQRRQVILTDEKGTRATVAKTDIMVSNGVIHGIDTVVMPN